jgi:photosystem II stability/assembly factor-like uncharacterized protein
MKNIILIYVLFVLASTCVYANWEKQETLSRQTITKLCELENGTLAAFINDGQRQLWYSYDKGRTWPEDARHEIPIVGNMDGGGYFINKDTIWAMECGDTWDYERDYLVKSTDAGLTWEKVLLPDTVYHYNIDFLNSSFGIVCGFDGCFNY